MNGASGFTGTIELFTSPTNVVGGEVAAKQTERGCWQEIQWPTPPLRHGLRPRHLSPNFIGGEGKGYRFPRLRCAISR